MAKEIINQTAEEIIAEVKAAEKAEAANNTEPVVTEKTKKEGFFKKHKKTFFRVLAVATAFGAGAGIATAVNNRKNDSAGADETEDDVIDSTGVEIIDF